MKKSAMLWAIVLLGGCQKPSWYQYTSQQGRLTYSVPELPRKSQQQMQTPFGLMQFIIFTTELKTPISFSVSYSDFPTKVTKEERQKLMQEITSLGVEVVRGKLLQTQTIKLGKHTGVENLISAYPRSVSGEVFMRSRVFLVGRRLYQLVTVTPNSNASTEDVTKFFDSFQITS